MPERVEACPHCDSYAIAERSGNANVMLGDPDDPYVCYDCRKAFEEPVEREQKGPTRAGGRGPGVDEELLERVREVTAEDA